MLGGWCKPPCLGGRFVCLLFICIYIHSPGYPGTHYIDQAWQDKEFFGGKVTQADFKLAILRSPSKVAAIISLCHLIQLHPTSNAGKKKPQSCLLSSSVKSAPPSTQTFEPDVAYRCLFSLPHPLHPKSGLFSFPVHSSVSAGSQHPCVTVCTNLTALPLLCPLQFTEHTGAR